MTMTSAATPQLSPDLVDRYLALLGVERAAPGYALLAALNRAHRQTLTFDNITAILRRYAHRGKPVPPIDAAELLTNWEQGRGGGVCFELAEMFGRLLTALGYQATPIFGSVRNPGDHQAVVVDLDGKRYLVEVGSSMPVFEPLPLPPDGAVEWRHLGSGVRFRRGSADGEWLQERWADEAWQPVFSYDLNLPADAIRDLSYQRHHIPGYGFVVGGITLIRCTPDEITTLRSGVFTRATAAGVTTFPAEDAAAFVQVARDQFALPNLPIAEAAAALAELLPDQR